MHIKGAGGKGKGGVADRVATRVAAAKWLSPLAAPVQDNPEVEARAQDWSESTQPRMHPFVQRAHAAVARLSGGVHVEPASDSDRRSQRLSYSCT